MTDLALAAARPLFREHSHTMPLVLRILDLAALLTSGVISYFAINGDLKVDAQYRLTMALSTLIAMLFFELTRVYSAHRVPSMTAQLVLQFQAICAAALTLVFLVDPWIPEFALLSNLHLIAIWAPLSLLLLVLARVIALLSCRAADKWGWPQTRIVIAGLTPTAIAAVRRVDQGSPWFRMKVIGYVDDGANARDEVPEIALPRLGSIADIKPVIVRERVAQVWIGYPLTDEARVKRIMHELRHETVSIRSLVDYYGVETRSGSQTLNNVAGIPTLDISVSPISGVNRLMKEAEDRALAMLFLLTLSPLMLFIAAGVKLSSPGPVFYRQQRIGWNNRPFMMLKFRSMPVDVETTSGPKWAKPGESRATPFGAWLRKTSLDELPQFINVLKGDMSVVGPRPERPVFVEKFKDEIPEYMKKHMVKAGITGWAQVNGWRGDTDLDQRIAHDLYYIRNWSIWFDLWIGFKTVFKGMVHKNAY